MMHDHKNSGIHLFDHFFTRHNQFSTVYGGVLTIDKKNKIRFSEQVSASVVQWLPRVESLSNDTIMHSNTF